MINYSLILATNYSGRMWCLSGNTYEGLQWSDELTKPTQADLDGQWAAVKAQIEANAYKEQRAKAYPSIQEQLDMQYWDGVNGTTTWADAIAAIKEGFPK